MEHNFVVIDDIEIDILMAPLIKHLWDKEIRTSQCCQGSNDKRGYICFPPGQHAKNFGKTMKSI